MAEENNLLVTSELLYKDRSEWKDLQPVYNTEEEDGAVKIAVTDTFRDAFAYLRAILQVNEYSDRALELTTSCTQLNPANYTVWQYRRNILLALEKDLNGELKFCEETIFENPKNYQVWHHRRVLVECLKNQSKDREDKSVLEQILFKELDFTQDILADDTKNYHAWQHRQWIVDQFNNFNELEMDFSVQMLSDDLRNNSAWNYRYFIVSRLSDHFKDKEFVAKEIKFVLQCIKKIPGNESGWNYLSGILLEGGISSSTEVIEFCNTLYDEYRDNEIANRKKSPHLLSFMVDIILELLEKKVDVKENVNRATELLEELKILDPVRLKYWAYQELLVHNVVSANV